MHFGHLSGAYLPADVAARFNRMKDRDVITFLALMNMGWLLPYLRNWLEEHLKSMSIYSMRSTKPFLKRLIFRLIFMLELLGKGIKSLFSSFSRVIEEWLD